jgi:hypothetical protein
MIITREQLKEVTGKDYYDGSALHTRLYAWRRENISPLGSIVAFRAPMEVTTGLVDLEDSLEKDYIYSDDAVNFIWEIPNVNAFGAVAFQRLFNGYITHILHSFIKEHLFTRGDDIITLIDPENPENYGKYSVSIAYSKDNIARCHTAINIEAGKKAPPIAYSTHLSDTDATTFMKMVIDHFYGTLVEIGIATTKV